MENKGLRGGVTHKRYITYPDNQHIDYQNMNYTLTGATDVPKGIRETTNYLYTNGIRTSIPYKM